MASLLIHDRRANKKSRIEIASAVFRIGKRATSQLVLDQENISRDHCEIIQTDGAFRIRDLGSRNGTFVGGQRIVGETPLADGVQIQLGQFILTFNPAAPAAKKPPTQPAAGPAAAPAGASARQAARSRQVPVELKKKIHERLLDELDLKHVDFTTQPTAEVRQKAEAAVLKIIRGLSEEMPVWVTNEQLVKEIADEALVLGPLEDFLADDSITEVMVNNWDRIYVERNGKIELTNYRFTDDRQVLAVIRRILAPIGRRIDESSPMVDARLADGSRVNAIIPPLSLTGPTLTIRKFSREPFIVDDLVRFGTLTEQMAQFLEHCVKNRRNLLITGGTGSGKTTLLNVVSAFVPGDERIITIEDAAELKLPQEHVVSLEAKPPNIEGKGAIPIRKLVINALRMRPNRIIVGECRGGEALDMLQAMNTGHDGSLTTLHANSPRDSLNRLETLVLMAGMELPSRAIREQVASAIHLIVHTARLPDGKRKITAVTEVTGMEGNTITLQDIYIYKQTGIERDGAIIGQHEATGAVPKFIHALRARGIPVDMKMFA